MAFEHHQKLDNAIYMAKICPISKKGSMIAGGYSNRVRATKFNPTGNVRKHANFQKKRIFVPELNKTFTLTLSTKGIKTLNKNGAYKTLKAAGII
jgi:large subunit ribosomal protein L28